MIVSFLQALLEPGLEENPQRALATRAANLLQIGEFQFLQVAYHEWFGSEMSEDIANKLFQEFMVRDHVPFWGLHYARRILALHRAGSLDDSDPHYHRYDRDYPTQVPQGAMKFCAAFFLVAAIVGGVLWLAHWASPGGTSVLPPYFQEDSLKPGRLR